MSAGGRAPAWLVDLAGGPAAPLQLVVFPHAGGSALAYAGWRALLPADGVHLRAVEAPGHGRRAGEAPIAQMDALLDGLGPALAGAMDRPTVFFGHSLGAAVAFAAAAWLADRGHPAPIHLGVSGRRAPSAPRRKPPVSGLPEGALRAELARLGGTPKVVLEDTELMALFLPVIRADLAISEAWSAPVDRRAPCPVSAYGGDADPEATAEELDAWGLHASGWFHRRLFGGTHFFLQERPGPVVDALLHDLHAAAGG